MESTPIATSTYLTKATTRTWDGMSVEPPLLNDSLSSDVMKRAKCAPPVTQMLAHYSSVLAKLGVKADHDEELDCIDFMSVSKDSNRFPLKILTAKPTMDQKIEIVSASFTGGAVADYEINTLVAKVTHNTAVPTHPGADDAVFRTLDTASFELVMTAFFSTTYTPKTVSPRPHTDMMQAVESQVVAAQAEEGEAPAPILISIEGNIGAGKSTVLNVLKQKHPDWVFIDEPVDTWTALKNADGTNLLEHFYQDQVRWAYTFQNCALLSRFTNIENTILKTAHDDKDKAYSSKRRIYITERCLDTDKRVFAQMMYEDKKMNKIEMDLYCKWYHMLHQAHSGDATALSAIVYINTAPDVCAERIVKRSRGGEEGIPLEYLKSLDSYQRSWCENSTLPTMSCDSNRSPEAVGVDISEFVSGLYES